MGSGVHLNHDQKAVLVHQVRDKQHAADFIYDNFFYGKDITLAYLTRLCSRIREMTPDDISAFLVTKTRAGSKRKMLEPGTEDREYLDYIQRHHRRMAITELNRKFRQEFYDEQRDRFPSLRSVYRAVHERNTHKVISWKNIHRDPQKEYEFLNRIAAEDPSLIVDIDGMVQTAEDFRKKYGWAPKGEELEEAQIRIDGKTFAVHAAMSVNGFMEWSIYEGTVTDVEFTLFLEKMRPHCAEKRWVGLFDNAPNQRTDMARTHMQNIFHGVYYYCAPYCPHLKPVEHGFSLVKRYIREHYDDAGDPIAQIHAAFLHYSDRDGMHGKEAAANLFNLYRRNHEMQSY